MFNGSLGLGLNELFLVICLIAAGQDHVLHIVLVSKKDKGIQWKVLGEVEEFYDCIGGIIGSFPQIQTTIHESKECQFLEIHPPTGCDLSSNTEYASQAALWGIECLPDLGEKYPLGGSADRLGLVDSETDECLPAAMLPYCGRTLLEGLIRDLQPLVPTVSAEDGNGWSENHLCPRKGATAWQVSNVAATDVILALAGIDLHYGKKLRFVSCKRIIGATEGINVLIEKKNLDEKWAYGLSCIEYTEFNKFGITSGRPSPNSLQAEFPANTNILYVDLPSAELVGSARNERSLPGIVFNTKKSICPRWQAGVHYANIADNFLNAYPSRCYKDVEDKLDTFIVYNERRRVTSSAKKKRKPMDTSLHQCKFLTVHCWISCRMPGIDILKVESNDKYVDSGPPFLIFLHPALGPVWEVTRQKVYSGFCKLSPLLSSVFVRCCCSVGPYPTEFDG
ncbi:UDP-glucose pyrophosphorylase 3 isoform 4 [Hibiscus syriacus]|uniref:UDP-glucose pyrophosphorylase 3 isoform 4 n=1 Tax=Hibiscus syriacus TaxID=106335 RepID=A0A6A2ZTU0_HIBSY|nr:UDP-glucose pyrophosphorylase 3 isoform 4 [Hibiscus syriacus]